MSPIPEAKTGAPNIQDVFLNYARREKLPVTVHLLDGREFEAGLLDEIRTLLATGVPPDARPFGGLVYRQAMEHLRGVRDEASTRALIAQENRKYARRQLIWFRKEPNLVWFDGPGTNAEVQDSVIRELAARDLLKDGRHVADT